MSITLRLLFLLSTIWNTYVSCTSPHPNRPRNTIPQPRSLSIFLPLVAKVLFVSLLFLEISLVLLPTKALRLPTPSSEITPQFFLGSLLNLLGGRIRQACYNALGRFFTFEMGTHQNHKLITTGPYAFVRHPSYTGGLTALLGCLLVLNSSVWIPRIICGAACSVVVGFVLFVFHRIDVEDEMLRKEFGVDWESWKEQVPYKLVPGIY
ncbi:hypothetical protein BDQ17DRAFT_1310173 [Cyathus striatus]|nr:hypothetical protein BDQ17DRAFT_1310173 [Cyathus striatus]